MPDIPFWVRILVLVALMAIVAGADAWVRRRRARRWKEYLFILAVGCLGAVFGAMIDLVTSSISADYFICGKELSPDGIRWRAMVLGLEAGFSAGAIAGALCLFIGMRNGAGSITLPRVAMLAWRPLVLALVLGAAVPLTCSWFDPFGYVELLGGTHVGPGGAVRFLTVWHIHTGVYLGLGAGVVWMIVKLRRLAASDAE